MENIEIMKGTKESIPETKKVINEGYKVNHQEGAPESKPYFPETYIEDIESGTTRLFIAKSEDTVIGSVQYEDKDGIAYLSQMTVDPVHRKKGIGAVLVQAAEHSAQQEGFEVMQLTAMVEKGLPGYYKDLGYVEVGKKERPTYTLIVMEKTL
jgi:ribosomal protein S18 acetylase RimI-like enzyme